MTRVPRRAGAVGLVALAAVLASCAASPDPVATMTGDPLASPLSRYIAVVTGFDDPDWRQQKQDEEQRLQDLVAQCMADEGFEYVPWVQPVRYAFDRGPGYDPDDAGWVAQWGYGVVASPSDDGGTAAGDPNGDIVAELGAAEQDAYYVALLGPDWASGDGGVDGDTGGCYGDAYREVRGDDPALADENAAIMAALADFTAAEADSPDYAELDAEWASCMADAGRGGFTRQGDAEQSVRDELSAAPADEDSLDALHDREVDLALADLGCREDTDYRTRASAIRDDHEEQFIDDHRAELDVLVAEAEAGGR